MKIKKTLLVLLAPKKASGLGRGGTSTLACGSLGFCKTMTVVDVLARFVLSFLIHLGKYRTTKGNGNFYRFACATKLGS
ncbi:MAG: hypothetical protein LBS33_04490, partial [Streptococcaceae bacterium]|nr:hypothetical protein [Streptococcaceae bacterium]